MSVCQTAIGIIWEISKDELAKSLHREQLCYLYQKDAKTSSVYVRLASPLGIPGRGERGSILEMNVLFYPLACLLK